jgi:multiple sugar transport system ATP-binding protein
MARVVVQNVSKIFTGKKREEIYAVREVSLTAEDKEFLVLVGPSGCGKSTLLRMIAGLEEIDHGTIQIGDVVVNQVDPKDRDVAMVFQNYALYPHMTVYENMAFGLKLRKFPRAEIEQRVRDAAEILGLTALFERLPKALSGGQRQRVAVGRAIVRKPKVFLFDEPLSNLDAQMRVQMRTELSKLHERLQTTMIYVTHDQTEAMTLGDRIAVLKEGRVQQVADPVSLYQRPENVFVGGFIGSPAMSFLDGKLTESAGRCVFQVGAASGSQVAAEIALSAAQAGSLQPYQGRSLVLGIRPEDLIPEPAGSNALNNGREVSGMVELVEPVGSETYVYLKIGTQTAIARAEPAFQARINELVRLRVRVDGVRFFDTGTRKAVA